MLSKNFILSNSPLGYRLYGDTLDQSYGCCADMGHRRDRRLFFFLSYQICDFHLKTIIADVILQQLIYVKMSNLCVLIELFELRVLQNSIICESTIHNWNT